MSTSGTVSYGDETLPDSWVMDYEESGGMSVLPSEVAQNERTVHGNFFDDFDDLFNDEDLD
jgi:hypothetical protein